MRECEVLLHRRRTGAHVGDIDLEMSVAAYDLHCTVGSETATVSVRKRAPLGLRLREVRLIAHSRAEVQSVTVPAPGFWAQRKKDIMHSSADGTKRHPPDIRNLPADATAEGPPGKRSSRPRQGLFARCRERDRKKNCRPPVAVARRDKFLVRKDSRFL